MTCVPFCVIKFAHVYEYVVTETSVVFFNVKYYLCIVFTLLILHNSCHIKVRVSPSTALNFAAGWS